MSDAAPLDPPPPGPKPKWPRSWRRPLTELLIVVVGVGLALAAQQAAEALNDRSRAAAARTYIRAEIANNLRLINLRAATEACISKRLDEVNELIAAASAGTLPNKPIWIGRPPGYAMIDNRYNAATQSGAVSLFDDAEQSNYGLLYSFFATYFQSEFKEGEAWADLRMLEEQPPPSPAIDARLRSAIKQARQSRWLIQRLHSQIMIFARQAEIAPDPPERHETQSTCLPLHTPRAEAVKMTAAGRWDKGIYDEP